ncbi:hypothetical protein D0Z07_0048 [Hyphodiscus hymeniophilus]|uniref:Uncharacterized protein n=1 Tax=Hyphodiscus hymeniophilus TaxID=353542 RepID=A0A9P6VRW7_9HELO|nr:hypothetical protein D0Z07_0048 [Hyphodiscus hymeniophilus]
MSWASGIIARHKEPYRPQEVDRACGVPQTAPEAGPKTVGEVMRVEFWLIGVGAVVGLTAIMLLLPDAGTKSANAVQKHIRSEREAVERARGDREEEETPRMRKLELEEMADAKRDPANRQGDEKK